MRTKNADESDFSKWIAVLLTQPRHVLSYENWVMLLEYCAFPDDKVASLFLFDFATRPSLRLKEPWHVFKEYNGGAKIAFSLNIADERDHGLQTALENLFLPNIAAYAPDLLPVVTANLTIAHNLLQVCEKARADYDPFRITTVRL